MAVRSWIRTLFESRSPRTIRKAPVRCRPSLEALEDRAVPAVTFGTAVSYGVGLSPVSPALGDFNGDAFGVANNTTLTVNAWLAAVNQRAVNGVLYNGNTNKWREANDVFSALNEAGGLG